jgi:hypothetical protein
VHAREGDNWTEGVRQAQPSPIWSLICRSTAVCSAASSARSSCPAVDWSSAPMQSSAAGGVSAASEVGPNVVNAEGPVTAGATHQKGGHSNRIPPPHPPPHPPVGASLLCTTPGNRAGHITSHHTHHKTDGARPMHCEQNRERAEYLTSDIATRAVRSLHPHRHTHTVTRTRAADEADAQRHVPAHTTYCHGHCTAATRGRTIVVARIGSTSTALAAILNAGPRL